MIKRGQSVYRANDPFLNLFTVVGGSLKTRLFYTDGREQICSFPISGDLLGLDGIGTGRHTCEAVALEDSQVCVIQFELLERRCREDAATQHHLHRLLGAEIVRDQQFFMLLSSMCAEERLADFLIGMSRKLAARGYSAREFNLRMSREDIGNHLGIKLETVSRTFSQFRDRGWLSVRNRHITIEDLPALQRTAHEAPPIDGQAGVARMDD